MHTYLSNEFTSNWLDDSDSRILSEENNNNLMNNLNNEYSSHDQFVYVKD